VDVSTLSALADRDVEGFICNLTSLNAICEQVTQFRITCNIDMLTAILDKDSTMDKVEFVFKAWSAAAAKFASDTDVLDEKEDIVALAQASHALKVIRSSLESALKHSPFHFHRLEELVVATSNDIEAAVTGRFYLYVTEMSHNKFDLHWKPRLLWVRSVCNHFSEMDCILWKQLESSLFAIVDGIKSDLHRASGEIDNMCSLIRDHSGMVSG